MPLLEPSLAQVNLLLDRRVGDALTPPAPKVIEPTTANLPAAPSALRRLLFVINSLEGGGAERVFSLLVNSIQPHLARTEIDVLLLDDKRQRYSISAPVNFICLASDGSLRDSARRFKYFLDQRRPDLVMSFLTRANYLAAAFANSYGYRCLISERSDTSVRLGDGVSGWAKKQLVRLLYPRAHGVIAVSEGIKQSLARDYGVADSAINVIHNPCDLPQLQQLAQQTSALAQASFLRDGCIVAAGRLVDSKRFDLLIRAYARGGFTQPLVILGEGPRLKSLQTLAFHLGVAERVVFAGFLANPYSVMARASVYVLCSELEGFPNSLLEAMGLGLPVIATNCHHGPAEILDETIMPNVTGVHQARHGLLIPTGDEKALTEALRQVLTNPLLKTSLAVRARQRATHYTVPATVARYADAIQQQLATIQQEAS
ncbi:MAG TPA: glycosyltransferase [Dongiaceae bacterium]|nr:glycosyltransferase [Dongiaceae bacterium]